MPGSRGGGGKGSGPPGKSLVAVGFLRNTGTDSHREDPLPLCPIGS